MKPLLHRSGDQINDRAPNTMHSGQRPELRVVFTSSPDVMIGRKLIGLRVATWSSEFCNLALFAYEIERLGVFLFPQRASSIHEFECWFIQPSDDLTPLHQIDGSSMDDPKLIGCTVVDLLVPALRDDRLPDSQLLVLSSGFGIAQESGTPHGIIPSLTFVAAESLRTSFVSFRTGEH